MSLKGKYYQFKEQLSNLWSYCKMFGKIYDFDYSSLLLVEQNQLRRICNHISNHQNFEGWEVVVQRINLAIKLLDIILDSTSAIRLCSNPNVIIGSGDIYVEPKWELTKYVNTKNAYRFVHPKQVEAIKAGKLFYVGSLYDEKAWKLYYKLREQYTRQFWD